MHCLMSRHVFFPALVSLSFHLFGLSLFKFKKVRNGYWVREGLELLAVKVRLCNFGYIIKKNVKNAAHVDRKRSIQKNHTTLLKNDYISFVTVRVTQSKIQEKMATVISK